MFKVSRISCSVIFCSNSWYKNRKMDARTICEIHKCKNGTESCDFSLPFQLIPFPTETKKDPAVRYKLISIVNHKHLNYKWQLNSESRICSKHFVDFEPIHSNPLPTLDLGYTPKQVTQLSSPPKKPKRKLENDLSIEDLNKHVTFDHDYIKDKYFYSEVILLKGRETAKKANLYISAFIRSVNTYRKKRLLFEDLVDRFFLYFYHCFKHLFYLDKSFVQYNMICGV